MGAASRREKTLYCRHCIIAAGSRSHHPNRLNYLILGIAKFILWIAFRPFFL